VLAVVVAGFLFTRALSALGPMALTAITAVVPALTALAAWPLLGEALGVEGLIGVGLVSAAMLMGVAQTRGATAGAAGQ
jgi:drug/metabolite transporter (DMT)-like permease